MAESGKKPGKKLRGVVVGAGYFSRFHLDAWREIPEVRLTALCDLDGDRGRARCREYGIPKYYADVAEMLDAETPDFVDVITGPETHRALCGEAAGRGIAVICQKPLAPDFHEARALVAEMNASGVPFMVHENFRFQPWHRESKKLIAAGAIGDRIQTIAVRSRMGDGWQPDAYLNRQPYFRTMPRMLVHEAAVHFLDTFRFLCGEVVRVYADLRRLNDNIRGEDTGCVLLEFASGARGLVSATRYHESAASDPRYTFGDFVLDGSGGSLFVDVEGRLTVKKLGQPIEPHEYFHENVGFAGNCVLATQRHFVEQMLGDRLFETRGDEYLKTLIVQEAVYRSAESRMPVETAEIAKEVSGA